MKKIYLAFVSFWLLASAHAQLVIFDDDYGTGISFQPFGGSTNNLSIVEGESRPGSAGTKSLKVVVPAAGYTGGAMVASENRNATAFNAVSFWIKASKSATLNVAGIGNNAGASNFASELNDPIPISTTWKRVIIPIPDPAKLTSFNGLWHFAEGADEGTYDIWLDDVQYENIGGAVIGAPSSASMNSQNLTVGVGGAINAQNVLTTIPVEGVPTVLKVGPAFLTFTSDPADRITFDANGTGTAQSVGSATVTATLAGIAVSGVINVTVTGGTPAEPTEAAPAPPGRSPEDVISLFSDAFTSSATIELADFTPPGNTAQVVSIAGNNTLRLGITGGPFHGFNLSNAIDLTNMEFLHYDLWIGGNTQPGAVFNTTVSYHAGGHLTGQTTGYVHTNPIEQGQEGKWLSYDIPFRDFAPNLATSPKDIISQIVFTHVNISNSGPIFIDNIYFYKPGPLPVKLLSFHAGQKANSIILNWQTADEINNQGFGVERSRDGRNWSPLGFVKAPVPNNSGSQYAFEDATPLQGMNFYRLRQMDLDGKFSFSPVRQINFNVSASMLSVYPNPSKGSIHILVNPTAQKVSYNIISLTGRTLQSGVLQSGGNINKVNIEGLAAGIYMLQVTDQNGTHATRFVVQ